jgi:hypothetical protein
MGVFNELQYIKEVLPYLAKKLCEFLVIEDVETTTRWNFTDSGRMKPMTIVAVTALNKYATITKAFSKHFTADIIQMNTWLTHYINTGMLMKY